MSFGRRVAKIIGRTAELGDEIDEGLNRLFGQDRNKPGEVFSRQNVGSKATIDALKIKEKDHSLSSGDLNSRGKDLLDRKKSKDRKFM